MEEPNPLNNLLNPDLSLTDEGKRLLTLAQLQSALNGNEAMLKHLGYNYLDQTAGNTTVKVQALPFEDLTKEQLLLKLQKLTAIEYVAQEEQHGD